MGKKLTKYENGGWWGEDDASMARKLKRLSQDKKEDWHCWRYTWNFLLLQWLDWMEMKEYFAKRHFLYVGFFITNVCGLGFLVIWIFPLERGWRYEVFSSGCVKGIIKKFDFLIYGLLSMRGTIEDLGGFLRGWVKGTITEICFLNILVTVFVICLYKTVAIWKT